MKKGWNVFFSGIDFLWIVLFVFYFFTDPNSFIIFITFIFVTNTAVFFLSFCLHTKKKSRLNFYYTYTENRKSNEVELRYEPLLFFHYVSKLRFLTARKNAIQQIKNRFPNRIIIGRSMTINSLNKDDDTIVLLEICSKFERLAALVPSLFLTASNLGNLFRLRLSKKLFLIIFVYPFVKFRYQ